MIPNMICTYSIPKSLKFLQGWTPVVCYMKQGSYEQTKEFSSQHLQLKKSNFWDKTRTEFSKGLDFDTILWPNFMIMISQLFVNRLFFKNIIFINSQITRIHLLEYEYISGLFSHIYLMILSLLCYENYSCRSHHLM